MGKTIINNDVYFGTRMIQHFIPSDFSALANKLADSDFMESLSKVFDSPSQYIYSIRKYPLDVRAFFRTNPWSSQQTPQTLIIGGRSTGITGVKVGASGDGYYNSSGIQKIASFTIARYFNNFMDFAPYTRIEIYIPYFNFIELPVNEIMGKTIDVYWGLDLITGMATYWVQNAELGVISTNQTQVGYDVPYGQNNGGEIARNNITNGLRLIAGVGALAGGIATKGGLALATTGVGLIADTGINAITGNVKQYQKGNIGNTWLGIMSPTTTYLIYHRPKPITITSDYNKLNGVPYGETIQLSNITGYTEIGKINFNPMNEDIYDDEIEELIDIMRTGIIL